MVDINNERSLTSQLRAYAVEKALKGSQRQSRSIHGSSFYKCSREQVYGLLGYEQTNPFYVWSWDLAARHGDAIHALVQQELLDSGKILIMPDGKPAIEVTLGRDTLPADVYTEFASYKLGVRIDAVPKGQGTDQVPIEIKTIDPEYLTGPKQKWFPEKLADYESQLQMSLNWWRNTETGERCNYGLIYVINRGDISQRLEFVVEYDPLFIEPELKRVANIRDHWLQAKLPEPEPERHSCGFCKWVNHCSASMKEKRAGGYKGK
jgi:hypothetical protein